MANRKLIELGETETKLLIHAASELIPILQEEENHVLNVKQAAFDYFDMNSGQIFQVQVTVTRSEHEFIPTFTTEVQVHNKQSNKQHENKNPHI